MKTAELLHAHLAGMQLDYVIWHRSGIDMGWLVDTMANMSAELFRIEGNVPS